MDKDEYILDECMLMVEQLDNYSLKELGLNGTKAQFDEKVNKMNNEEFGIFHNQILKTYSNNL